MKPGQFSFGAMCARRVAAACQEWLDDRELRIECVMEALIDAEMKRRWFKPKSRDEARRRIEHKERTEYEKAVFFSALRAERVEHLLALAKMAGDDEVFVCADDAYLIGQLATVDKFIS